MTTAFEAKHDCGRESKSLSQFFADAAIDFGSAKLPQINIQYANTGPLNERVSALGDALQKLQKHSSAQIRSLADQFMRALMRIAETIAAAEEAGFATFIVKANDDDAHPGTLIQKLESGDGISIEAVVPDGAAGPAAEERVVKISNTLDELGDLSNVDTSAVADGDHIYYSEADAKWKTEAPVKDIGHLSDVNTAGLSDGDYLYYDLGAASWKVKALPSGTDIEVQDDGVKEADTAILNFTTGLTATEDAVNNRVNVSWSGSEKVKVSANDTTADYLYDKLTAGDGISITETNDGGNESVTIAALADHSPPGSTSEPGTFHAVLDVHPGANDDILLDGSDWRGRVLEYNTLWGSAGASPDSPWTAIGSEASLSARYIGKDYDTADTSLRSGGDISFFDYEIYIEDTTGNLRIAVTDWVADRYYIHFFLRGSTKVSALTDVT